MTRKGIDTSNFGFARKYLLSWARRDNNLLTLLFIVLHIYSLFKVSIVIKLILLRIWFNVLIDMALLPFSALVRLIVTKKDSLYILVLIVYTFFSVERMHYVCVRNFHLERTATLMETRRGAYLPCCLVRPLIKKQPKWKRATSRFCLLLLWLSVGGNATPLWRIEK
jgi:hypothetical protein